MNSGDKSNGPLFLSWFSPFRVKVYKDPHVSKYDPDGSKSLFRRMGEVVLVHPDHWDEFVATINKLP